jgi:hypothetical protein
MYLMIQYLIDTGAFVNEDILKKCDGRASYILRVIYNRKTLYNCITSGATSVILIAHKALKILPPEHLQKCSSIKLLLRYVSNGKLKVPFPPKPYLKMAHEIIDLTKGAS